MAWADTLQPGSFRGAPFLWDAAQTAFGRRGQNHEFPLRDTPEFEDLGRKSRGFTLTFFTLGANYAAERDALITACETEGPGRLVHPLFGSMMVTVTDCQVSESAREGGKATFAVTFLEPGDISFDAAVVDTSVGVVESADDLQDAASTSFLTDFDVTDVSPDVLSQALSDLSSVVGTVQQAAQLISSVPTSLAGLVAEGTALISGGTGIFGNLGSIASSVISLVSGVSFIQIGLDAAGALLTLADWASQIALGDAETPVAGALTPAQISAVFTQQVALAAAAPSVPLGAGATPSSQTAAGNQRALYQLLNCVALAQASQAASASTFASADAAIAARDQLSDLFDATMDAVSDDTVFSALRDLRVAVVTDLTTRAANLPNLMSVTLPQPRTALTLAHLIYDDPSWADDIVARNNVRHPGFVPALTPLQVLTDVA